MAELARENRLETDGPTELIGYLTALRAANRRVFGDLLDMTLAELTAPQHARHEIPAPPRLSTAKDAS